MKKMKIWMRTRAAVVAAVLMISAGAASAVQALACQQLIDDLITTTETAQVTGKKADKDLTGLIRTLDAATETLAAGKLCDSIKKLEDFKIKVDQLVAAGRLTGEVGPSGDQLIAGADAAIGCIAGESMTAGGSCTF
jgi:hypothetical protein